uniref:BolA-like protein 3 n=1 Tax=Anopheles christyi TaxID=43041 RepID=A0A182JQ51_9DIPT
MMKNSESNLRKTLEAKFPQAKNIVVSDISGGCGSMYEIFVESKEFKGLSTVKQHRLITETLKSEIKDMHGLRIHTSIVE